MAHGTLDQHTFYTGPKPDLFNFGDNFIACAHIGETPINSRSNVYAIIDLSTTGIGVACTITPLRARGGRILNALNFTRVPFPYSAGYIQKGNEIQVFNNTSLEHPSKIGLVYREGPNLNIEVISENFQDTIRGIAEMVLITYGSNFGSVYVLNPRSLLEIFNAIRGSGDHPDMSFATQRLLDCSHQVVQPQSSISRAFLFRPLVQPLV